MAKSIRCSTHGTFHAVGSECSRCETEYELGCWRARARNAEEKVTELPQQGLAWQAAADRWRSLARAELCFMAIFAVAFVISLVAYHAH